MGKQGPCCHCGVTSTPLWRNGPPDKPVLCNACGSRWRTKGTLANYTPLHARAETGELEDYRLSRVRNIPIKNKETKVFKRKLNQNTAEVKRLLHANRGLHLGMDEDNSNRSSSGSAMSNSDSCVQFGSGDMSDLTGPSQSIVWDSTIPSRKRTCVNRPTTSSSALERLTRDLHTILKEQQSSQHSGSCEEELLFESDTPMVSVEIGHGSVLIRHPSYVAKEEESVASSFPVDKKPDKANEAYSHLDALSAHCNNKGANILSPGTEKCRKVQGLGMQHDQIKRENTLREMLQVLGNPKSPICCIDLGDVLNFDVFQQYLTIEERRHLLKYLHPIDTAKQPDSLRDMFHNALFKENLSSYQKLLAEGVLDLSFLAPNAEDCQTLRRLALGGFTKSKWVEQYNQLKEIKYRSCNESSVVQEDSKMVASGYSTNVKKSRDLPFQKFPAAKPTMKSPKRVTKGIYEHNELMDVNENCFKPKGLFMSPPPPANNNSLVSNSFHYMDESSDQDMLLEVPSNGSFPEAELLLPSSSFGTQASASSSTIYPQLVPPR